MAREWGGPAEIVFRNPAPLGTVQVDESSIDHGNIAGLSDNDHPQYALQSALDAAGGAFHQTFTETAGTGTYTGATMTIPAGALVDPKLVSEALWTAETSAVFDLVDGDGNHLFPTPLDLKTHPASPPSALFPDYHDGAFHAAHAPFYYPSGTTLTATVDTVSVSAATGITRLIVNWSVIPDAVAATKA